jgi:hypothetical protein
MHPKISNIIIGLIIVAGVVGFVVYYHNTPQSQNAEQAKNLVRNQVTLFGQNLKMVPLLAGTTTVDRAMEQNYAMYVAPELLTTWESDPTHAPGRLTSSPSPDHIDITSITLATDGTYIVNGNVIEVSSSDTAGSNSGSYPVRATLENRNDNWLITRFQGYPPVQ